MDPVLGAASVLDQVEEEQAKALAGGAMELPIAVPAEGRASRALARSQNSGSQVRSVRPVLVLRSPTGMAKPSRFSSARRLRTA